MMDSIEGARHDAHDSRSPDRSASDHYRSRQAGRVRQDVMPQTYRGLWSRRVMREKSMKLIQHYQEKAARADRLADDPYQKADMRAELRSTARRWRHLAEHSDWLARRRRYPKL
jgi:hypothetical protein